MRKKTEKNTQVNIWQKHAVAIEKSKVKTVKDLVAKLQPGAGKKPLIKEITKDDAVEMLIDIGLSVFPAGSRFNKELQRKFKGSPEKIHSKSFLSALETIAREKELDSNAANQLRKAIKVAQAEKTEDPFKLDTPLSGHPATAFAFRKTIMDEVANALELKPSELEKLKQHYRTPDEFIKSSNGDIKEKTDIPVERIAKFKSILSWTRIEGVSVSLANALATKLVEVPDVIKMNKRALQKVVKKSGISVPYREKTLKHLDQVILAVRKAKPDVAYYLDVISTLELPAKARTILDQKKVKTFDDLRREGVLDAVIAEGKITDKDVVANLNAHLSLSTLSVDVLANKKLIEKGYTSPARIAATSPKVIRRKMSGAIEDKKIDELLSKASAQTNFLNNLHAGFKADQANRYRSAPFSDLFKEKNCHCRDCESAVSPLAYLADLLEYARKHVLDNGNEIKNAFLMETFHQPFAALPATCEAMDEKVLQVKLCIEVLRSYLDSIPLPPTSEQTRIRNEAENTCRLNCYKALLIQIGTSFDELRLARSAPVTEREALMVRLGLDIPARLNEMLLDTSAITESDLVRLFGALHFGLIAKPTPKIETWRLNHLSAQWHKQDWPNEELEGGQPIIDPDIIGPDDFRSPFPVPRTRPRTPEQPFDIWLRRREWVDQRLRKLNGRNDLNKMLEDMYTENIAYGKTTFTAWSNSTPLAKFVDLLEKVKTGRDSEVEAARTSIETDLNLNVEAFKYLMSLQNKFNRAASDPRNEQLTDQEWREFYSILVQAQKRKFFPFWRDEEKIWKDTDSSKGIIISLKHFWISEREPSTDIWPPNVLNGQPLIDPDLVKINDLAERTVGKRARQYWKNRKQEIIDDLSAPLEEQRVNHDLDRTIKMALGHPNPGDSLQHDLDALKTDLSSSNQVIIDKAKKIINDELHLSIEDFGRLMTIMDKDAETDSNKKPTDSDWKDINRMLTRAMKIKRKYPIWFLEEKGSQEHLVIRPRPSLKYWQAYKAKLEKWRASTEQRREWQNILRLRSQRPIIDPDLIEIKSIKAPGKVLTLWNGRNSNIKGWSKTLDHDRNAAATSLEGFDAIVGSTLNAAATELVELSEEEKHGYSIEPRLKQLSLTRPAFNYLVRIRRLLEINEPVLTSEWEEVYSILIQVKKQYNFEQWRKEEKKNKITLSPDYFIIPEPDPAVFLPPQPRELPKWRAKQTDFWDWQDTLQARIDQRDTTISSICDAVQAAEKSTLPALRDALILASGDGTTDLQQQADLLAKQLFIDTRAGGCKKTTRISQAIETIQGLLLALRTGQLKSTHQYIELDAPDFEKEWKWLGSYTTWRAIMFVFLYPENLLVPTLRILNTPLFNSLKELYINEQPREEDIQLPYSKNLYSLRHIDNIEIVESPSELHMFGSYAGRNYWSVRKNNKSSPELEQTFWIEVPQIRGSIIGTAYEGGFIYVFFSYNGLGFTRCQLPVSVDQATNVAVESWEEPKILDSTSIGSKWDAKVKDSPLELKLIILHYHGYYFTDDEGIERYRSSYRISEVGLIDDGTNWGKPSTIADGNLPGLPDETMFFSLELIAVVDVSIQGFGSPGYNLWYLLIKHDDLVKLYARKDGVWIWGRMNLYFDTYGGATTKIFYASSLTKYEKVLGIVRKHKNRNEIASISFYSLKSNDHYIINLTSKSIILPISSHDVLSKIKFGPGQSVQGDNMIVGKYQTGEWFIGTLPLRFTGSTPEVEEIAINTLSASFADPPTASNPKYELIAQRRAYLTKMLNRSFINYLYAEDCYFAIPLYCALKLHQNGQYIAALDWFKTIYNYTAPVDERKVYPGLKFEEDISTEYERSNDWLLDPLNPHSIAKTRANAYTRYTLFALIRCLLDYADSEFTRDTAESLPRARRLYNTALELLDSPELQQKSDECDEIIGRLSIATGEEPWSWWAPEVFNKISKIKDTNQLCNTVDNLVKIIKNGKTIDKRIKAAKDLVADIDDSPPTIDSLLNTRLEKTEQQHQILLGQDAIVSRTTHLLDRYSDYKPLGKFQAPLSSPFPLSAYEYCIPPNPVLQALRMRTEANLYKLRTCRNIAGVAREIQAYEGPTDTVSGLPYIGAGGQLVLPGVAFFPPSQYRYKTLIERAKQLVGIAGQMEASMLSMMQKWSGGEYDILTARQNVQLTREGNKLQDFRVTEAQADQDLANLQLQAIQIRVDHYTALSEAGNNTWEDLSLAFVGIVSAAYTAASAYVAVGSIVAMNPQAAMKAAELGVQAMSQWSSFYNQMASYERRMQEWLFQKNLAVQDIKIGGQQKQIADDHVKVVEKESQIARLQAQNAEEIVEFLNEKFDNAELYHWMSGILTQVYSYFLQQATALAKVAANQLAFERQVPPPSIIQSDYWESPTDSFTSELDEDKTDRKGLTGSARLQQDIDKLDQYAFKTDERKLNLVKSISLAQLSPVEFQRFRETGVLSFHTPMEIFDRDFPGHYLRLISKVRTSVIALIPPTEGIKATLTASRISRTVIGGDIFQTVQIHRGPDQVALTSPNDATGMFELDPHPEMLRPFEGIGVDTSWEFRLPKAANSFDFRSIADIVVTIEYTSLNSFTYRQQVIQQLRPTIEAERFFSFRHQLPDQWYELHNPERSNSPMVVSFKTRSEDFPQNLKKLKIKHVVLYFSRKDSETFEVPVKFLNFSEFGTAGPLGGGSETIDGVISTRRGKAGSWSMIGKSPIGDWELALPDTPEIRQLFKDERIEDILLVISYTGRTPEWPS